MQAGDIERHLTQLGQELTDRGIQKPIRVLMIGGAYMLLLAKMQRSTDDVDILWLDEDDAFQRAIDELREGVQAVAEKQRLEPDWFNYMTHLLMYDVVTIPRGRYGRGLARSISMFHPKRIFLPSRSLQGERKISKIADYCCGMSRLEHGHKHGSCWTATFRLRPRPPMLKISSILLRSFFRNESREYPEKEKWCVRSTTVRTLQTIAEAYRQICEGQEPWIALGNFRNAWYGHAKDRRVELVSEPLGKSAQDTEFAHRWGAFCASTVEFLCERYDIPCPQWVHDPGYTLETPWWHTERADDPKILRRLIQTTPEAFARRKIFCGNRLYQNKYEMSAWVQEARAQGITNPGDVWRYARQKEISIHGG